MTRPAEDKTLGTLIRDLTEDLSTLVRNEIALARYELRKTAANVGLVGALFGAAAFLALVAVVFLITTIVLALAIVIPTWLATLIMGVVLIAIAVGLVLYGRSRLEKIEFAPTSTVESVKSNVEAIKADLSRLKRDL
ncbi:MAG: phage holin family protein [Acidobacteriota bacterium]